MILGSSEDFLLRTNKELICVYPVFVSTQHVYLLKVGEMYVVSVNIRPSKNHKFHFSLPYFLPF